MSSASASSSEAQPPSDAPIADTPTPMDDDEFYNILPAMFKRTPVSEKLRKLSDEDRAYVQEHLNEPKGERSEKLDLLKQRLLEEFNDEEKIELEVRTDRNWLIKFARGRKWDMERAAELMVNFYRFKQRKGYTRSNRPSLELFQRVAKYNHVQMTDKKDKDGHVIMFVDLSKVDLTEMMAGMTREQMQHISFFQMCSFIRHDAVQIRGAAVIQNFSNVSFTEILSMSGGKEGMQSMQKERMEMMKDCLPMRMKRIIMYRSPWWVSLLITLAKPFMGAKMRGRMCSCSSREDLQEYIEDDQIPEGLTLEQL